MGVVPRARAGPPPPAAATNHRTSMPQHVWPTSAAGRLPAQTHKRNKTPARRRRPASLPQQRLLGGAAARERIRGVAQGCTDARLIGAVAGVLDHHELRLGQGKVQVPG